MRIAVIIALFAIVLWIIINGFRNSKRISFLGVFIFLVPALVLTYFEYQYQEQMTMMQEAVTDLSGNKDITLECQRLSVGFFDAGSADQTYSTEPTHIALKYKTCNDILTWVEAEDKTQPSEDQVKALHLLSKELVRVAGEKDHDRLECLAIDADMIVLQYFGADPNTAYWINSYYKQNLVTHIFARNNPSCVK